MARVVAFLVLATLCAAEHGSPLEKVIELLNQQLEKAKTTMQEEKVNFAAFDQWAGSTKAEYEGLIADGEELKATLEATIEKMTAQAKQHALEMEKLDAMINTKNAEIAKARKERAAELKDFKARQLDLQESIDALTRAIDVLKLQNKDVKQEALLQVRAKVPAARHAVDTFLQLDPNPKAYAYEAQSGGIIELLSNLLAKFKTELFDLETEEANTQSAHDLLVQDLISSVEGHQEAFDFNKQQKGACEAKAAEATAALNDCIKKLKENRAYLENTNTLAAQKTHEFGERQKVRGEEIAAIEKAIEILSSDDVSGAGVKHDDAMYGTRALRLLQIGSDGDARRRIVAHMNEAADNLKSTVLSALAIRISADPFVKVRELIEDLINRLEKQATEEADQFGWCKTKMNENEKAIKDLDNQIAELDALIDAAKAFIAKHTEEIKDLTTQIADLDDSLRKATEDRNAESKTNHETIDDAKVAQEKVSAAMEVLRAFYARGAKAVNLVQDVKRSVTDAKADAPKTWDTPYKGQQSGSLGVFGLLEVILEDFARLEQETDDAEKQAQRAFEELVRELSVKKAECEENKKNAEKEKADKEDDLKNAETDRDNAQGEHDAQMAIKQKLKPVCAPDPVPFAVRDKQRKDEIQSLQECLQILTDANN